MIRMNPWRYNAPPGWSNIQDAPTDGTIIEIQNNWGVAPTFGLYQRVDGRWQNAHDKRSGVSDGPHLSWRPSKQAVGEYVDPTGGAQDTANYWLQACGMPPRVTGNMPMGQEPAPKAHPSCESPEHHVEPRAYVPTGLLGIASDG